MTRTATREMVTTRPLTFRYRGGDLDDYAAPVTITARAGTFVTVGTPAESGVFCARIPGTWYFAGVAAADLEPV